MAFWLIPTCPRREALARTIAELADEFDAPRFEPHLTLGSGRMAGADAAIELAGRIAAETGVVELACTGVGTTADVFTTLFLEFQATSELGDVRRRLRPEALEPSGKAFRPHLSLLYRRLPEAVRAGLVKRFSFAGARVAFDRIVVVRPGGGDDHWARVAAWETVFGADLRSIPGPGQAP